MAKGKTVCNVCGKAFDTFDDQEHIGFHQTVGYGSNHYDGYTFDLDICCNCFDKLMDQLVRKCKINPIVDPEY